MKRIRSMSFATIVTVVAITIITIIAELSEGFRSSLKSVTGHHWITKSVIAFILFFGVYLFVKRSDDKIDVLAESWKVIWITLLASLVLFGFYLWHFLSG